MVSKHVMKQPCFKTLIRQRKLFGHRALSSVSGEITLCCGSRKWLILYSFVHIIQTKVLSASNSAYFQLEHDQHPKHPNLPNRHHWEHHHHHCYHNHHTDRCHSSCYSCLYVLQHNHPYHRHHQAHHKSRTNHYYHHNRQHHHPSLYVPRRHCH